jgi:ArsR family transcriptional regulator, arsenate/arsenite/antimonite-responsive transcriptional repressor
MPYSALIIHDDLAAQAGIKSTLTKAGFEATTASDHLTAQPGFSQRLFDLIVVKTDLPEFDGRRLTMALRRPGTPNADTPVLGITPDKSQAHARECWRSGMNALVLSPGNGSDLLAAVRPLGFYHLTPAKPKPIPVRVAADAATSRALFWALSQERRLQLFAAIAQAGELSADGVKDKAHISRQLALHHLKPLVKAKLITSRQPGKEVLFAAQTEGLESVAQWLLDLAARLTDQAAISERSSDGRSLG